MISLSLAYILNTNFFTESFLQFTNVFFFYAHLCESFSFNSEISVYKQQHVFISLLRTSHELNSQKSDFPTLQENYFHFWSPMTKMTNLMDTLEYYMCGFLQHFVLSYITASMKFSSSHRSALFSYFLWCFFSDFFMGSACMSGPLNTGVPQCSCLGCLSSL